MLTQRTPSLLQARNSQGDFADYLIRDIAIDEGCEKVATFDQALLDDSEFIAP
jgi:predicted nucleic-acid-binding protein